MWIENLSEEIEHRSGSQHAACFSSKPGIDRQDRSKHKSLQRGVWLLVQASIIIACSVKLAASKTIAKGKGWGKGNSQAKASVPPATSHTSSSSTIELKSAANRILASKGTPLGHSIKPGHVWCKHGEWDHLETPLVWRVLQSLPADLGCAVLLLIGYEPR